MQRAFSLVIRSSPPLFRTVSADFIWHNINDFDHSHTLPRLPTTRSRPAYTTPTAAISQPLSSSLGLLLSRSSTSGSTSPKTKHAYYKYLK
jgi:hypothetical protein